jgi:hypothetical protein
MTAELTLPHIMPSSYPIAQLVKDLSSELPYYFDKCEATFRRVHVKKFDEFGNERVITFTNLDTGEVRKLGPVFDYVENIRTGQIYFDDKENTRFVLAVKCMLVFFCAPFYTLGAMLWNAHQILRSIGIVARNVFHAAREDFAYERFFDATRLLYREIKPFPKIVKDRCWEIVKAPIYGVCVQIAALSGMIRPLHGRQYIGMILKAWHHGASYKESVFKELVKEKNMDWNFFWNEIHSGKEFFLAHCFLERGIIKEGDPNRDPNIQVLDYDDALQPYFGE